MSLSHYATLKIAAGGIEPVNVEGRNFWVVHSPVDLEIKLGGGEFATYAQGTGLDNLPDGRTFRRLEIRNPSLGAITVGIYVGGPLYRDSRIAIVETNTEIVGQNINSLAAGGSVVLSGSPGAGQYRRAGVLVSNADAAAVLTLYDAGGGIAEFVLPGSSRYIPLSGYIKIKNDTGLPVDCAVAEIWQLLS